MMKRMRQVLACRYEQSNLSPLLGVGLLGLELLIAGCALGPNFHRPEAPKIKQYTEHPTPKKLVATPTVAGNSQYFNINQKITAQWWTVFQSKALDKLIREALVANPDMRAASASLLMAHQTTKISRGAFLPVLYGNYFPTRQKTAGTLASNLSSNAYLYTLTTESLSVSYVPDVFGATRRQLESAKAMEEVNLYQYEAIYLTLTSNIALNAIQEASLRGQIATVEKMIKTFRKLVKASTQEKRIGSVGSDAVVQQRLLLAQTETLLPALQLQLAENRHLLASLLGRYSSENLTTQFTLQDFVLPRELPLSLPSELIDNRPDIRAAEARMHAASAQVGVAMANRLPNILMTANGGYMPVSQSLSSIPSFLTPLPLGPSMFWGMGANLMGTIFDSGSLYFQKQAAVAAYDASVAQYKRVVLNAFESVADSLKALEMDAIALQHTQELVDAAAMGFESVSHKRQLGSLSYMDLLNAEKAYEDTMLRLTISQAARFEDTVALFQALGGGWALNTEVKKKGLVSALLD